MSQVTDRKVVLLQACAFAEEVYRRCGELEAAAGSDELTQRLAGMPLSARWVNEADSILFFKLTKTALLFGSATGEGFIIGRLPSAHPSLIRWSAPCFVRLRLRSWGLSLGRQSTEAFMPCMTPELRRMLSAPAGRRSLSGLEASFSCLGGLLDKSDILSVASDDVGTVGISHTRGALLDLSYSQGSLAVDAAKNALVYGADLTALQILHGTVDAPREMQPLLATLNAELSRVERVTPPARVSASLERYSTGRDPDRRMVLPDGRVIKTGPPSLIDLAREAAKDK